MYNVCEAMFKVGLPIDQFVEMGSITAEEYEGITGERYE